MSRIVEFVGGPMDGRVVEVPNAEVRLVESVGPRTYTQVDVPIRLTRNGWRAFWAERTPA